LVLLAALTFSCDEQRRYETLKFFFDGVEEPESMAAPGRFVDSNLPIATPESQGPTWYVHEPRKDCTNCHDTKRQSRADGRAYLISSVPQLCYECHDDFAVSASNVHGPVAVGVCLECHNPHKSQLRYLLEKPIPELCYICHDTEAIESIPEHFVRGLSSCNDCHDSHASRERYLLKEGARRLSENRALSATERSMEEPAARPQGPPVRAEEDRPELRKRKQKIADIFYKSMDLYREGRLVEAREGFVAVLNSGLIPQAMARTILGYISDIDERLAERKK
jgi:predicted CXXCH cytochrome family protein